MKLRGEIVNFADFAALWIDINSLWSGAWYHRDYVADRFGDLANVLSPSRQVCTVRPILELIRETFQLYDDIESGRIDVALTPIPVPASLEGEVLFEEDFVCVLGSQRKRQASRPTLKQYLDAPHAIVNVLAGQQTFVDRPLAELGLRRRVALIVPFFVPATLAILDTDLIVTIPRRLAQSIQTMRQLSIVNPPTAIRSFPYLMVWHPRLTGDPAQVWFREQVRVVARTM